MADIVTAINTQFGTLATHVPSVVGAAIGVALLFWGTKRLIGLFKSVAR